MRFALAIAWLAAGAVAVASALRHRAYIESLPKSGGNDRIRRQRIWVLVFGVGAIAVALANLYLWLKEA